MGKVEVEVEEGEGKTWSRIPAPETVVVAAAPAEIREWQEPVATEDSVRLPFI
jgi:hypothetical protein